MSTLTKVLAEEVNRIETSADKGISSDKYRLTHHLMPPVGWLNDPNGLCQYNGRYHVFFQYSPFDAEGGLKIWGHYSSEDLISWKYEGAPLLPDTPWDCHGVYSGSALAEDGRLHIFYTGNVKLDGDFDYINNGRESSALHVESEDGIHFGPKKMAVHCSRFPAAYTCHIRDPKVWKEDGTCHMVLGGRQKGDKGAVLFYQSSDFTNWTLEKELTTERPFGYMWECPDYFKLEGHEVLSVSPQGLERENYRFQNIYQSGYFFIEEGKIDSASFQEWDMGFDFYAPQTFLDEKGRRILIGWMGMPDASEEYTNPTIEQGWQHCLTLPRELTFCGGKILQNPVEEIQNLRRDKQEFQTGSPEMQADGPFDLEADITGENVKISLGDDLIIEYKNGIASLSLSGQAGAGRKCRRAYADRPEHIRILKDTSAVEIYFNHGETVFSTRYYPASQRQSIKIEAEKFTGRLWNLAPMKYL